MKLEKKRNFKKKKKYNMRKVFTLFLLFFVLLANAQEYETLKHLRDLTQKEAVLFSEEIGQNTRGKFVVGDVRENAKSLIVSLVNPLSDNVKVLDRPYDYPDDVFEVVFLKFKKGENKDLEILGEEKYKFYKVKFNYIDLFPIWKSYFQPNANINDALLSANYMMRESRVKENGEEFMYKFNKVDSPKWEIVYFY